MSLFLLSDARDLKHINFCELDDFQEDIQALRSFLYCYGLGDAYSSDTPVSDIAYISINAFELDYLGKDKDYRNAFKELPKRLQNLLNSMINVALNNPDSITYFQFDNFR